MEHNATLNENLTKPNRNQKNNTNQHRKLATQARSNTQGLREDKAKPNKYTAKPNKTITKPWQNQMKTKPRRRKTEQPGNFHVCIVAPAG